ncbi:putative S-layer protein (plasmid) [Thermobacillus composti KWC4]|uniref:Putative S-layer protein n=1 Tax=Thermobacillus composti (strain DSM 18247 / JCM 13945 / KWC4) TaxID=717605 RepID=L0EJS3_THECK|nr:S-layer homology domain-containing protein [Thermobacillus composti]AGA60036.1 putative S-layer protein [Thermobacillus composti KWC4]
MKKFLITAMAVITFVGCVVTGAKEPVKAATSQTVTFSDIKGHWAENDIKTAIQKGYVNGYPDGTFRPNGTITRSEYAALLSRVTTLKPASSTSDVFPDLKTHWSKEEVNKLVALGFIDPSDYPNGFGPEKPLTRYEMMKWISTGLAKSDPSFQQALADTKNTLLPTPETYKGGISAEQIPYIALVKGTGIIEGFEDGSFRPSNTTTRAEVTAILLRYAKVEGTRADKYRALNELREVGTTGTNMTSLTKYRYTTNLNGKKTSFADILDKPIKLKNNSGSFKVHRIIFVDSEGDQGSGVYAPMFVSNVPSRFKNSYFVFSDISLTSTLDKGNPNTLANGMDNGITSVTHLDGPKVAEYGLPTIPVTNPSSFFVKGQEKRFWVVQFIDKVPIDNYVTYSVKTDSGDVVGIILNK